MIHNFPKPIENTMGGNTVKAMEGIVNSSLSSYEKKSLDGIISDTMGHHSSQSPSHDILKVEPVATKKPIGARKQTGSRFV
jgi:hypothetical protein